MFVLIAMYFELDWTKIKKYIYCIFIVYLSRIRYRVELIITVSRFSFGGPVAQADRRSRSTAGVPSSCLGLSMWISWWKKWNQGRFSRGFSRFPYHKFHSTISTHSTHSFRFISSAPLIVRQAWSAGALAIHRPILLGLHRISSLDPTLCWTRVEDIYFICIITNSSSIQQHNQNWKALNLMYITERKSSTWLQTCKTIFLAKHAFIQKVTRKRYSRQLFN